MDAALAPLAEGFVPHEAINCGDKLAEHNDNTTVLSFDPCLNPHSSQEVPTVALVATEQAEAKPDGDGRWQSRQDTDAAPAAFDATEVIEQQSAGDTANRDSAQRAVESAAEDNVLRTAGATADGRVDVLSRFGSSLPTAADAPRGADVMSPAASLTNLDARSTSDSTKGVTTAPKPRDTVLALGVSKSGTQPYGDAVVECVAGCVCAPRVISGVWQKKTSQMTMVPITVSAHPQCDLRLTVRPSPWTNADSMLCGTVCTLQAAGDASA